MPWHDMTGRVRGGLFPLVLTIFWVSQGGLDDEGLSALGGKGVGSQGDGTVQFLCKGSEGMEAAAEVLARDLGLATLRVVIPTSL